MAAHLDIALAALLAVVLQEPPAAPAGEGERACCAEHAADSAGHCAGCRRSEPVALPALGDDATEKERWLRRIHDGIDARPHYFLSRALLERFRADLERARAAGDPLAIVPAHLWYGSYLMFHGRNEESIAELEGTLRELDEHPELFAPSTRSEVQYRLAVAWFRLAERRNCVAYHNAQSCIFPLRGGAVHVEKEGAARAAEVLLDLLGRDPAYDEARWLLNVAHMALGSWPDGVPEAHRYPRERFASSTDLGRFADVAPRLGLDRYDRAGSAVVDDWTGDGLPDVLTSSFDSGTPLQLSRNRGDGTFEDVTERAGLARQLGGSGLVAGDVDGDGALDLLVLRGAGLYQLGEMPCSLLRQARPGVFEDVTASAGIELAAPARSAAFADVEGDGDLDLFVGYQSMREGERVRYPGKLWRNDGRGRFEDATAAAGIDAREHCAAVAFGDVDGDGFPDLYLSHSFAPNVLYQNRGDGTFEGVTRAAGVAEPLTSGPALFLDDDQDGDLDLFVALQSHATAERAVARWYWDGTVEGDTQRLYRNDGRGRFRDVTAEVGLGRVAHASAAAAGDLDGDGFPDLYLGTGAGEMSALWPNLVFRGDGGRRFLEGSEASGLGHLQKGQGIAPADLDADGDLDLFLQVGGHHLDDGFGNVLFENPGAGGRWVNVRLVGRESNRSGVGARLRLRVRTPSGARDVFAFVGPDGPTGSGPLARYVGLGDASAIELLEVTWPCGRGVQRIEHVPLDAFLEVREGEPEAVVLERRRVRLGGGD